MDFAQQIKAVAKQRQQTAAMLAHCKTIADSIGLLADAGKQVSIRPAVADRFFGTIQAGEYLMTGKIPASSLIADVVRVSEDLNTPEVPNA